MTLDGTFARVNPALCALTGYGKDELEATTFQMLTHAEDLEAYLAQVQRLLEGTIASCETEQRYFHKDGRPVWVLLNVSLLRGDAGEPSYL